MWTTLLLQDCGVPVLDNHMKAMLGSSLIFTGLVGAAVNGWLVATLFLRAEVMSWSHLLLLNIGISCLGRSLLGGFPFSATSALASRWLFGDACCMLYAFLHQLFSVAELLAVMLLCLERYQVTRHAHMGQCAYMSSLLLMWIASMVWSLLPLLNYGRYGCDAAGIACDLDWRVEYGDTYSLAYNVSYLVLGVLLAVILSCGSLWKTVTSPESVYRLSGHHQRHITKATIALVAGMYIMWTPQAILSLWRLMFNVPRLSQSIVFMAPVCAEFSAVVPTLAFLCYEPRLRNNLLGLPPDDTPEKPRMRRHRRRAPGRIYGGKMVEREIFA
ncbi:visual pigment-like receptor peropsin [Homalodisca vitripennis]|uniref:G-protein coupled receptors family 1 profile domain-containing protein n=1 Tax=Homalodisca liturata TaxID=320908 RepID=A0A1B6K4H0_9HEMI|nr:visual pigment-like receptor peropsin [Homalodisca vitripennis]